MEIYQSLQDYKKVAKIGDIITLGGRGLMCGLKATSKNDCYKVYKLESYTGFLLFKAYRAKNGLTTATEQQVGVIDKKTYSKLPIY